jgi:hypothetical protein
MINNNRLPAKEKAIPLPSPAIFHCRKSAWLTGPRMIAASLKNSVSGGNACTMARVNRITAAAERSQMVLCENSFLV